MKADEWKHWTLIYASFCLMDVLPTDKIKLWQLLVDACTILCKQTIVAHEVHKAHDLLQRYCQGFEELYGKENCVPNMHMSLHIKNCVLDYGPTYAFWCFSFERFNGILGKYQTNNHAIPVQLMRKFVNDRKTLLQLPKVKPYIIQKIIFVA